MYRNAFNMLELVFLIVVVGVLAAVTIPRMERDNLYEMGEQVASHIKYTQHLAMSESTYRDNLGSWYRARWHISFVNGPCGLYYRIGSDRDMNTVNGMFTDTESARDPLSGELIYNNNIPCDYHDGWFGGVLLTKKYNIVSMVSSCNTQTIAFDHIGRPYMGVGGATSLTDLMRRDCDYTFTDAQGKQLKITVTAETGHAFITYI